MLLLHTSNQKKIVIVQSQAHVKLITLDKHI